MPPTHYDARIKLLQFVHRLYTDKGFQTAFAADPEGCMTEYALSAQQKAAVYHAGVDPTMVDEQGDAIVSDWWKAYALYKRDPAKYSYPDRKKYLNADRPVGEAASMAGVAALIAEELAENDQYQEAW